MTAAEHRLAWDAMLIFCNKVLYVDTAMQNAHKLAVENNGKSPSQSKPGTQVYELLETLRMYF